MGYESRVSGSIEITPPLNWAEYKGADDYRYKTDGGSEQTWLRLALEEKPVETAEGTLVRKFVRYIEPNMAHLRLKNAEEGVRTDLVALVGMFGGSHSFTGYLLRVGEHLNDVQRYWVEDGVVRTEKASPMTWEDGSTVEEV